jgi:hypothetical protein
MKRWNENIDPSTIPEEILKTERAKRNAGKRQTFGGGRPPTMRKCPKCKGEFSATELRTTHRC